MLTTRNKGVLRIKGNDRRTEKREAPPVVVDTQPIIMADFHGIVTGPKLSLRNGFFHWAMRQVYGKDRIKRWIAHWLRLPVRIYGFMRAVTGGRVSPIEFGARMAVCRECPQRVIVIQQKRGGIREQSYCNACGCPHWYMARLNVKNQLRRWYCPARRHAGTYPDDSVRKYLLEQGLVTQSMLDRVPYSGGCGGCGKGK